MSNALIIRLFLPPAIALAASVPLGAQARSADFAQARSEAERAICSSPALRSLDQQLGAAYRTAAARMGSADGKRQLLATQKAWLADADGVGSAVGQSR